MSDATRVRIVLSLLQSPATPADLATKLRVSQPRTSSHLAVLRRARLVSVSPIGRQHVYKVDPGRTHALLKAIESLTPSTAAISPASAAAIQEVRRDTPIRRARVCYDHLAGVAGVILLDKMLDRGLLVERKTDRRPTYELTAAGESALRARGVEMDKSARRNFAFGCPDWTERKYHLGGELGMEVLRSLLRSGILQSRERSREFILRGSVESWLTEEARLEK